MRFASGGLLILILGFSAAEPALPQSPSAHVVIPKSSLPAENSSTQQMHTTLRIMVPAGGFPKNVTPQAAGSPPFSGYLYETPASFACIYRLVPHPVPGCSPNVVTANPQGGISSIAIVDAYDYPTAASDLAAFSTQFGLSVANFKVIYATGAEPAVDPTGGWELEEALDIEWAHSMAPNAKIYLVEAASNSTADLLDAVLVANAKVAGDGGGEVSMSWGSGEFAQELQYDFVFTQPGIVYLAAAGDSGGTLWPSVSPNVVSAGGTSLSRNPSTGALFLESTWQDTGGGPSLYEARPHFQDQIRWVVGDSRGTPDISLDANPASGVWVLATNAEGDTSGQPLWYVVGGTSLATPSLAGIINSAGNLRSSSQAENSALYRDLDNFRSVNDITYGNCGVYLSTFAQYGWDFCSGIGTPRGK